MSNLDHSIISKGSSRFNRGLQNRLRTTNNTWRRKIVLINNSFMESGVSLKWILFSSRSLKSWCPIITIIMKLTILSISSFLESLLKKTGIMIIIPITLIIIFPKISQIKLLLILKSSIGKLIQICLYLLKISSLNRIIIIKNYIQIFKK